MFQNKTVKSWRCKNLMVYCLPVKVLLLDLVLPLMAYLAFLWVDGALIISGASGNWQKP
jgi:hypothetical protein